jgi:hypothetical protein
MELSVGESREVIPKNWTEIYLKLRWKFELKSGKICLVMKGVNDERTQEL